MNINKYNISGDQKISFNINIQYIIEHIENNLAVIEKLKNKIYFEMSKEQIIITFKQILAVVKKWQQYFINEDIKYIQKEYKEVESEISELDLCLSDYDDIFHCDGISYSLSEIGNLIIKIVKESEENVR